MRPRRRGRGRRRGGGEDRDENGEMEASGSPGSGAERLRQPSSPARQPAAVAAESGVGSAGSCQPVTESGSGAVFFFFLASGGVGLVPGWPRFGPDPVRSVHVFK
jgi:hypothetical protein